MAQVYWEVLVEVATGTHQTTAALSVHQTIDEERSGIVPIV